MDFQHRLLLLSICLVLASFGVHTKTYWIKVGGREGMCMVDKRHVPGVKEVVVRGVKAPMVKLQESTLAALADISEHAGRVLAILDTVAGIVEMHPAVGRGVTVLGLAYTLGTGALNDEPTLEDLREKTEKAFAEITKQTNDAILSLKDYVDNSFLKFEQDLMNIEYKTLYRGWIKCADYKKKADLDRCLKNQIDDIRSERPKFLKFFSDMKTGTWKPTVRQLQQVQAGMFAFRDYEQLALMALQTMVNYEGTSGAQFKGMLREEIEDAIEYAQLAVEWIKKLHGDPISKNACRDTIQCTNVKSGWPISGECSCKFDLALGDSEACRMTFILSNAGSKPTGTYWPIYINEGSNSVRTLENAAVDFMVKKKNRIMNDYFGQELYQYYMAQTLTKYWDNQILSLIPVWCKMVAKTKARRRDPGLLSHIKNRLSRWEFPEEPVTNWKVQDTCGRQGDDYKMQDTAELDYYNMLDNYEKRNEYKSYDTYKNRNRYEMQDTFNPIRDDEDMFDY